MKIGILSESDIDEAAYKILVESVLGQSVDLYKDYRDRGGWFTAKKMVQWIMRQLHFAGADGFVFIGDSDSTPPHTADHETHADGDPKCRLCQIKKLVAKTLADLPPRAGRPPLKIAVGMATPVIEAWLLSGDDPHCTEARFRDDHLNGRLTHQTRLDLKKQKYGSLKASSDIRMQRTLTNAHRIARDIEQLEQRFQFGFGHLRNDLAQW